MRLLHTADWQLGCKLLQAGKQASQARAKRLEAVEAVVDLAKDRDVDLVLIAGDTFEDHDVDDRTVRRTVRLLDELAPIPTLVLPGNHDPLVPGGVWDRSSWQAAGDHVHLLSEPAPVEPLDGTVVYPCPLSQKQSTQDPTDWIPDRAPEDDRLRIGLAHGALDLLPETVNFPIAADRAEAAGLDYLALGDWHGLMIHDRAAYPGTHEPTSYTEKDPGHALIVDLEAPGQPPTITPERVGQLSWQAHEATIQDPSDAHELARTIRAEHTLTTTLVRLRLELAPGADETCLQALEALREDLAAEAFELDWSLDATGFHSQQPVELPEGVMARVDEDLATILDGRIPDGPGQQAASQDPEILEEARALLHRLARREQL